MPIKKLKRAVKKVGQKLKKAAKSPVAKVLGAGFLAPKLLAAAPMIVGAKTAQKMLTKKQAPPKEEAPAAGSNLAGKAGTAMDSVTPQEIKVGGASFRKGGLVKDRMGRAMKKPGADAMGRAMKNPMKMMGGGMKKPKKMLGGGMTRGYKRGGMAKKGC